MNNNLIWVGTREGHPATVAHLPGWNFLLHKALRGRLNRHLGLRREQTFKGVANVRLHDCLHFRLFGLHTNGEAARPFLETPEDEI